MPKNILTEGPFENHSPTSEACKPVDDLLFFIKKMNEIFFLVDTDRTVVAASEVAQELLGFSGSWDEKTRIDDFFPKVYLDAIFSRVRESDVKQMSLTFPVKNACGREILLETRFNWFIIEDREMLALSCRDINGYIETISDLTQREDLYRTIFHESPLGFVHVNSDGIVTDCNAAFLAIFGFDRDEVLGVCLAEECGLNIYPRFKRAAVDAVVGVHSRHESQFQSKDETYEGWVSVSFSPVRSDNQTFLGAVGIVEDITDARRTEERVTFVSSHDALTGLFNRRACEEAIHYLDKAENFPLGVVYADLNCLKLANDAFGHSEGDRLLKSTADILRGAASEGDYVYRWGGDEFMVLLKNTPLSGVASRVKKITRKCNTWHGEGFVHPSLALGFSAKIFPEQDLGEVIKEAEDGMYSNKLRNGGAARLRILESLEERMHNMRGCAVGNRERRMVMWGEWALSNLDVLGDPEHFRLLCRYHDIGLLASSEELDMINRDPSGDKVAPPMQHMAVGYRIARSIAEIAPVAEQVLAHHEWWDGMGYPNQLRGEEIPYISRLVSLFDTMEAMISIPPDDEKRSFGEILDALEACRGRQFDPVMTTELVSRLRAHPPEFVNNLEV